MFKTTKYSVVKIFIMEEIYETKAIYRLEYELMLNARNLRIDKGLSQEDLSTKMGFVDTFVGKCESLNQPEKYNLRHFIKLKQALELDSLEDLFPNGYPADEQIIIHYKKVPKKKVDGTDSKLFDSVVVDITIAPEDTKAKSNKRKK